MSRVARWGNSPAVRIPRATLIEAGLQEGDAVVVTADGKGGLLIAPDRRREEAMERLRNLRWKLPEGYKFDREEINRRGKWD